jgi:hypothetical protein
MCTQGTSRRRPLLARARSLPPLLPRPTTPVSRRCLPSPLPRLGVPSLAARCRPPPLQTAVTSLPVAAPASSLLREECGVAPAGRSIPGRGGARRCANFDREFGRRRANEKRRRRLGDWGRRKEAADWGTGVARDA